MNMLNSFCWAQTRLLLSRRGVCLPICCTHVACMQQQHVWWIWHCTGGSLDLHLCSRGLWQVAHCSPGARYGSRSVRRLARLLHQTKTTKAQPTATAKCAQPRVNSNVEWQRPHLRLILHATLFMSWLLELHLSLALPRATSGHSLGRSGTALEPCQAWHTRFLDSGHCQSVL